MNAILVIGIGNILLKDEGAGVYCMQALEKKPWPDNVFFMDGGTITQDLFCLFGNYDHMLILDAVRRGNSPGTLYRLEEKDLTSSQKNRISLHETSLCDSLKMAGLLGNKPGLTILGIEPETIAWETGLSETLKNAFPDYIAMAEREIKIILLSMNRR